MFTGLVQTTARVDAVAPSGADARIRLEVVLDGVAVGESISVSGVCLTVTDFDARGFGADVSAETLAVTTLGGLAAGSRVNIERASRLGDRMGGHVVQGHVDGVARVTIVEAVGEARRMAVAVPPVLERYVASKGSVALDGVSLTVNALVVTSAGTGFEVMLVPHTLAVTTLGERRAGDLMNIEVDVLARYVARQLDRAGITTGSSDASLTLALERGGFL